MGMSRFDREQERLFEVLAEVGDAYFSGEAGAGTRRVAREFLERFARMSEPGLKRYYRELNPEFWDWVEKNASGTSAPG